MSVPAKREYHRYLIGRQGARTRELRERFTVRIIYPSLPGEAHETEAAGEHEQSAAAPSGAPAPATTVGSATAAKEDPEDLDVLHIIGKKENVDKAKTEILSLIKNLVFF